MGGFGSGRPSLSGRTKVEDTEALDVNRLHGEGCLDPGSRGGWQWLRNGEVISSIGYRASESTLHLSYRTRRGDEDWFPVEESVRIVRVPCNFGGSRPYFICPGVVNGVVCCRRVGKLYSGGRHFLCRHCYNLTYASRCEDELGRAWRRAHKAKRRVNPDPNLDEVVPPRPKGMWRRTYERRRQRAFEAEWEATELVDAKINNMASLLR